MTVKVLDVPVLVKYVAVMESVPAVVRVTD